LLLSMIEASIVLTFSLIGSYNPRVLEYLNHGVRDYAADPIPIYKRRVWEFQAVISGSCAPTFPELREEYGERRLWIFAPGNAHGWTGEEGGACEIVVFHFDEIPAAMRTLLPRNGSASVRLSAQEVQTIMRHFRRCDDCLHDATVRSVLLRQSAALDLCLILASRIKQMKPFSPLVEPSRRSNLVMSSLAWYEENMSRGPNLEEAAKYVGISVSHLRRIYRAELHISPNQEFLRRRMSRAKYLLEITTMSVSAVAAATGYGSVSSFSRAFAQACGASPKAWKRHAHLKGGIPTPRSTPRAARK
jgi:AraC-like DNA-binding protein